MPNSTDAWGALSEAPGRPHAGLRRRRQPQEPAVGLRSVRHPEPVAHRHRRRGSHRGRRRHRLLRGLLLERGSLDQRARQRRRDELAAAPRSSTTIKSGGNQFKGLENFTYETGQLGRRQRSADIDAATLPPTRLVTECATRTCCSRKAHVDLGGPIKRDKAWFFAAYNTSRSTRWCRACRRASRPTSACSTTTPARAPCKPVANNTSSATSSAGGKQKPKRGLSTLHPARIGAGAGQPDLHLQGRVAEGVISDRTFFDVNVGNYQLDLADGAAGRSGATSRRRSYPVDRRGARAPAGTRSRRSATTRRLKAQLTYYLPEKSGQPRLQVRLRGPPRLLPLRAQRHVGADPLLVCRRRRGAADRIRFVDAAPPPTTAPTGRVAPNIDQQYSGYAQDRWAPNNRLTITAGVRMDNQNVGYGDAVRKPLITDVLAGRHAHLPDRRRRSPARRWSSNTNIAPRLGFSYDLTGKGQTVLKGFYGRYYNNIADGFSGANPGGTNYAEYNFLDQNRNGRYDGPSELGALRLRIGGARRAGRSGLQDAVHRGDQRIVRAPVLGRVVGPRHLRAQEQRRLRRRSTSQPVRAGVGRQDDRATRQVRRTARRSTWSTCPTALGRPDAARLTPTSRTATSTTTPSRSRSTSGSARSSSSRRSADYQWRSELRSAD